MLHFAVEKTGFATALPMVLSIVVKVCSGPFSDHAACCGEKTRVMLFTLISQGSSMIHEYKKKIFNTEGGDQWSSG